MIPLALGLAVCGFAALALSNPIHHRDVFNRLPTTRMRLSFRLGGWVLLGVSLVSCVEGSSPLAIAFVLWPGLLTCAALGVALSLTYRDAVGRIARRPLALLSQARRAFESSRP